jgi:hypothetical protein
MSHRVALGTIQGFSLGAARDMDWDGFRLILIPSDVVSCLSVLLDYRSSIVQTGPDRCALKAKVESPRARQ